MAFVAIFVTADLRREREKRLLTVGRINVKYKDGNVQRRPHVSSPTVNTLQPFVVVGGALYVRPDCASLDA